MARSTHGPAVSDPFSTSPPAAQAESDVGQFLPSVPLDRVIPSPENPRKAFDDEALAELVASVRSQGILQPLTVAPRADGSYDLIAGERRWRAAREIGLAGVPVIVRPDLVGAKAEEARLVENLSREDLNPMDEAHGIQRLIEVYGLKQKDVAERLGKNPGHISKRLKLLELSPVGQKYVSERKISVADAVDVARLPSPAQKTALSDFAKSGDIGTSLRRAQASAQRQAERQSAIDTVRAGGVTVIDEARPNVNPVDGPYPLKFMDWVDPDWHATQDCHAAMVTSLPVWQGDPEMGGPLERWVTYVCTCPANHPSPATVNPVPETVSQEQELRAIKLAITQARRTFIARTLSGRIPKTLAQEHIERSLVLHAANGVNTSGNTASLRLARAWVENLPEHASDPRPALRQGIEGQRGDNLLRWALAVRLAADEVAFTEGTGPSEILASHLQFLESAGYTVDPNERESLGESSQAQMALA